MDDKRIDIDAGLEGSHQVSLSLDRLSPTAASYSATPSSDQIILTLSLVTLGAEGLSSMVGILVCERQNVDMIMS